MIDRIPGQVIISVAALLFAAGVLVAGLPLIGPPSALWVGGVALAFAIPVVLVLLNRLSDRIALVAIISLMAVLLVSIPLGNLYGLCAFVGVPAGLVVAYHEPKARNKR